MNTRSKIPFGSMTSMLAGILAMAPLALGTGAQAASPAQGTQVVHYGDLNLDSEQGTHLLYQRLRSASQLVCAPFVEARDLARRRAWQNCVDAALSDAVMQVNRPMLSALHKSSIGRPSAG